MKGDSYRDFEAATLHCARCGREVPVRKKLLLILPRGELHDLLCAYCGSSLGCKTDTKGGSLSL